jgi:hypothetical protein
MTLHANAPVCGCAPATRSRARTSATTRGDFLQNSIFQPSVSFVYFGRPYSLKDGINDGFLTPFKVRQIATRG